MGEQAEASAADDALLAAEVERVARDNGGSLPLGSFFLHRPDLKRILGDRKLKDFLAERDDTFELEDLSKARIATRAVPFGGRKGILIRLKGTAAAAADAAVAAAASADAAPDTFNAATVAGKTALNILEKVAAAEARAALAKQLQLRKESPEKPHINLHPSGDAVRVGYLSNGFKTRKKVRTAYALAPNLSVQQLFSSPSDDPTVEANRVAMRFAVYLIRFMRSKPETFLLAAGPRDERCKAHHVEGGCACDTYVSVVPGAFEGEVDMDDGDEPSEPRNLSHKQRREAERGDRLEARVASLLRGTNPQKGVDVAWIGQDNKVRKLLGGRALLAELHGMSRIEAWERDSKWVVRLRAAEPTARGTDVDGDGGDPPPSKSRRVDGGSGAAEVPGELLRRIGCTAGLRALDKPPGYSTEDVLRGLKPEEGESIISISRLDKGTSGVLIYATSEASAEYMRGQYIEHLVRKKYLALCSGFAPREGRIEARLLVTDGAGKNRVRVHKSGKPSITEYRATHRFRTVPPEAVTAELRTTVRCLWRTAQGSALQPATLIGGVLQYLLPSATNTERFSLLDVNLLTGRTHQIRVHMQSKGHPLVADSKYARPNQVSKQLRWCPRCFLHCAQVAGTDVAGGAYSFRSELPADLSQALTRLLPVPF